jgi:hypothetical protein
MQRFRSLAGSRAGAAEEILFGIPVRMEEHWWMVERDDGRVEGGTRKGQRWRTFWK